jgi:hypothetical protein
MTEKCGSEKSSVLLLALIRGLKMFAEKAKI